MVVLCPGCGHSCNDEWAMLTHASSTACRTAIPHSSMEWFDNYGAEPTQVAGPDCFYCQKTESLNWHRTRAKKWISACTSYNNELGCAREPEQPVQESEDYHRGFNDGYNARVNEEYHAKSVSSSSLPSKRPRSPESKKRHRSPESKSRCR